MSLHLTEERIRSLVSETARFARKVRSRRGRGTPLAVPDSMPDVAAGETLINLMGDQFDAVLGPGAGQFMADSTRLQWLLQILERGSVDEALAAQERRWSRIADRVA